MQKEFRGEIGEKIIPVASLLHFHIILSSLMVLGFLLV